MEKLLFLPALTERGGGIHAQTKKNDMSPPPPLTGSPVQPDWFPVLSGEEECIERRKGEKGQRLTTHLPAASC